MKLDTILDGQTTSIKLNEYTVKLATSEIDVEKKEYTSIDLGEYVITLTDSANDYELIARIKRLYPEITKYRNIEVLTKDRKSVTIELQFDEILEILKKEEK